MTSLEYEQLSPERRERYWESKYDYARQVYEQSKSRIREQRAILEHEVSDWMKPSAKQALFQALREPGIMYIPEKEEDAELQVIKRERDMLKMKLEIQNLTKALEANNP